MMMRGNAIIIRPKKLLGYDTNTKTVKGQKYNYMTAILYLAPADISGYEVCPKRTPGCSEACLYSAGRGAFSNVQKARISKTLYYFENRKSFMEQLAREVRNFIALAYSKGFIPVIRLNGTSDIPWERVPVMDYKNIMEMFPTVQFYDYTKRPNRTNLPKNYHLTFSLAEDNAEDAKKALANNMNVAVVFRNANFPVNYMDRPVLNGDDSDLRFLDGNRNIIGLVAKGKAKKDTTGFVKDVMKEAA